MTLYKNISVKTAILMVPMMKIEDDLYVKKIGGFLDSSLLHKEISRRKVAMRSFRVMFS